LNVFLAIAVDNLGNAQALTAAEERAELSEQVRAVNHRDIQVAEALCGRGVMSKDTI